MNLQAQQTTDCAIPPARGNSYPQPAPQPLNISALTRRMVRGDETAYRIFYDTYFGRLSRYLFVVTAGNEDAAREALQSALVRVVRHIKVFPNDAVFWSWLTVLARTALYDQARKQRRYRAFLDRFTLHTRIHLAPQDIPEADNLLAGLLDTSLEALPADERWLVESKYLERHSVRDLAEELSLSEKAVESRLVRVRQKLKTALMEGLKHA